MTLPRPSAALCVVGSITLAAALAGCGSSSSTGSGGGAAGKGAFCSGNSVSVAYAGPLSGAEGQYGQGQLQGLNLAASQINASGGIAGGPLKGCKIKILGPFDDKGDPSTGASIATKLRSNNGLLAYFGNVHSSVTLAVAPALARASIPLINSYSSNPQITGLGYKTVYRTILDDNYLGADQARVLVQQFKRKKLAVLWSNDSYGQGAIKAFRAAVKQYGGTIVSDQSYKPGDTDFSVEVTKVQRANPDGVALIGVYADGGLQVKQLASSGLKAGPGLTIVAPAGDNTPAFAKLGGSATNGVYIQGLWTPASATAAGKQFIKAFMAKYHSTPAEYSATAYDAMKLFATAAAKGVKDRASLVAALAGFEKTTYQGVASMIRFDSTGTNVAAKSVLLQVTDGQIKAVS